MLDPAKGNSTLAGEQEGVSELVCWPNTSLSVSWSAGPKLVFQLPAWFCLLLSGTGHSGILHVLKLHLCFTATISGISTLKHNQSMGSCLIAAMVLRQHSDSL